MISLIVENVRSFAGRHTVPIAPLTVFVGENSTGKSTLMAALSVVSDSAGFPFVPGFNKPPYQLGNYDTIATYKGGKYGRAKSFTLGYIDDKPRRGSPRAAEATYVGRDGQAELQKFVVSSNEGSLTLEFDPASNSTYKGRVTVKTVDLEDSFSFEVPRPSLEGRTFSLLDLVLFGQKSGGQKERERFMDVFRAAQIVAWRAAPAQSESVAPIRTKPERTYGGIAEEYDPSGDQVPFVLERLNRDSEAKDAQAVMAALERFGEEAALFSSVKVRKLGSKAGEPFQLTVKVGGRYRNLVDVGYGVSQALPVIVQGALSSKDQLLLIQQPEVHLHPRAQAALGSFLSELVAKAKKQFVIESHSDFIIDRVRQEVAAGRLSHEKVAIVFFERSKMETTVHSITVDQRGNVHGAPESYRAFFMAEEMRLLTRGDKNVSDY